MLKPRWRAKSPLARLPSSMILGRGALTSGLVVVIFLRKVITGRVIFPVSVNKLYSVGLIKHEHCVFNNVIKFAAELRHRNGHTKQLQINMGNRCRTVFSLLSISLTEACRYDV